MFGCIGSYSRNYLRGQQYSYASNWMLREPSSGFAKYGAAALPMAATLSASQMLLLNFNTANAQGQYATYSNGAATPSAWATIPGNLPSGVVVRNMAYSWDNTGAEYVVVGNGSTTGTQSAWYYKNLSSIRTATAWTAGTTNSAIGSNNCTYIGFNGTQHYFWFESNMRFGYKSALTSGTVYTGGSVSSRPVSADTSKVNTGSGSNYPSAVAYTDSTTVGKRDRYNGASFDDINLSAIGANSHVIGISGNIYFLGECDQTATRLGYLGGTSNTLTMCKITYPGYMQGPHVMFGSQAVNMQTRPYVGMYFNGWRFIVERETGACIITGDAVNWYYFSNLYNVNFLNIDKQLFVTNSTTVPVLAKYGTTYYNSKFMLLDYNTGTVSEHDVLSRG